MKTYDFYYRCQILEKKLAGASHPTIRPPPPKKKINVSFDFREGGNICSEKKNLDFETFSNKFCSQNFFSEEI